MTTAPEEPENETSDIIDIQPEVVATSNSEPAVHKSRRFRIAGDVVAKACADMPDDWKAAVKWFTGYCRSRDLGKTELAQLLPKGSSGKDFYSFDSIYQLLTGRRKDAGTNIEPIMTAIIGFKEQVTGGPSKLGDSGFIHTRLYDVITDRCQRALKRNRIQFVFGESQVGKSECFKMYAASHNHGETIYLQTPHNGSLSAFLAELALVLGIPQQLYGSSLSRRIIDSFDDKMLLIVDDAQDALSYRFSPRGVAVFTFLKELYNRKRPGIVLSLTNEGRDLFKSGPHAKGLRQLWLRRIAPLQLPSIPFADDLDKFAIAYGLEPAVDEQVTIRTTIIDDDGVSRRREYTDSPLRLQTEVIKTDGLGLWKELLEAAADDARERKAKISWGAVIKAYCDDQGRAYTVA